MNNTYTYIIYLFYTYIYIIHLYSTIYPNIFIFVNVLTQLQINTYTLMQNIDTAIQN